MIAWRVWAPVVVSPPLVAEEVGSPVPAVVLVAVPLALPLPLEVQPVLLVGRAQQEQQAQ